MKLVFIHGAGGWGGVWWKQLEFFTDADSVTLPGHPEGSLLVSIEEYADWLYKYIESRHYHDTVLVGHCLGGAIAMYYTLKYPQKTKGLILISTGASLKIDPVYLAELEEAVRGEVAGWVRRLRQHYSHLLPEERSYIIGRYREIGPLVQLSDMLCCDRFDINDRLENIRVPTLVICGKEDTMTPVELTKSLAKRIPGARLEILKGAAHQLFLEKPDEFNRAVSTFVTRLGP